MHGSHWYPCRSELCNKGRIPRPVPPTAQPLERVVLTSEPDIWQFGHMKWLGSDNLHFESHRWPGIVFEVRPVQTLLGRPIVYATS